MKTFLLSLYLISFSFMLNAQALIPSFFWGSDSVIVYADSSSVKVLVTVIDNPETEEFAEIEILSKSMQRFYVRIHNSPCVKFAEGWIEKGKCAVNLKTTNSIYNLPIEEWRYYVYDSPKDDIFRRYIYHDNLNTIEVPIMDYYKKWLKVQLILKSGEKIEGWIKDYCPYINGCEGM